MTTFDIFVQYSNSFQSSLQTILEAILGLVLRHLQATAGRDLRQEKETIHHIAVAMKTLITNSEALAK